MLVATHTRALLVYQGPALAWAARLELQPVAMRVTELGGVRGMIVALDDAGEGWLGGGEGGVRVAEGVRLEEGVSGREGGLSGSVGCC